MFFIRQNIAQQFKNESRWKSRRKNKHSAIKTPKSINNRPRFFF